MADKWELSQYVEEHPEDFPERWRLAKKLYLSWEYRHALEHLLVLKNDWEPKVNVLRYLAATYYRLGRFDDAVRELQAAIEGWPDHIDLRVQVARALEMGGKTEKARTAWEDVLKVEPGHKAAKDALKRLGQAQGKEESSPSHRPESDPGIDMIPGLACPSCGAQNSDEFDRCWQCHATLPVAHDGQSFAPRDSSGAESNAVLLLRMVTLAAVILPVLAAGLAAQLWFGREGTGSALTLETLYQESLFYTRLGISVLLLAAWPVALHVALDLSGRRDDVDGRLATRLGLALAGAAFAFSCLPGEKWVPVFVFPAVLSFFSCLLLFPVGRLRATAVWAMQYFSVAALGVVAFLVLEWMQVGVLFNPLHEIPALRAYQESSGQAEVQGSCPLSMVLHPRSSGSPWLDSRAGEARIEVSGSGLDGHPFEIKENGSTEGYEQMHGEAYSCFWRFVPGQEYTLIANGAEDSTCTISVRTLLTME